MADQTPADAPLIPPADLDKIAARIKERAPSVLCPACRSSNFGLVNGYFFNILHRNKADLGMFGEKSLVPAVATYCSTCGFLMQFSLGVLGLMDLIDKRGQNG